MKKLKLHPKSINTNTDINLEKKYFLYEINRKRTFKGKPLVFANKYISDNDCWLKFVAGSVHTNPKRKINKRRVAQINWIFQILDIYHKNESPYLIYSNIKEDRNSNDKFHFSIEITDFEYFLYFEIKYNENEDTIEKYVLLTAYQKNKNRL